jgi:hypothetical protein
VFANCNVSLPDGLAMSGPDVRAFLRDRGLADEIVAEGAEGLVSRWEQAAREAERERYPFGVEDWLGDLDVRQLLHELAGEMPAALGGSLRARLEEADQRLRAATDEASACLWGDGLAKRMKWKAAREWWYWRAPRAVSEDFGGER